MVNPDQKHKYFTAYLLYVTILASMGGLLYGYDVGKLFWKHLITYIFLILFELIYVIKFLLKSK